MSDELTHVVIGDLLGEALAKVPDDRINSPFLAAVLAFGSHAVMDLVDEDYTPDWTVWKRDAERFQQDAPYLAGQAMGLATEVFMLVKLYRSNLEEKDPTRRAWKEREFKNRVAGVLGAVAPDVIDGVYAYLHPDAWMKGQMLLPWHREGTGTGTQQTRDQTMSKAAFLTLVRFVF